MKLKMFRIAGQSEVRYFESLENLQSYAYNNMIAVRLDGTTSVFKLTAIFEGCNPINCEAVFFRGCNGLAVPEKFSKSVWSL